MVLSAAVSSGTTVPIQPIDVVLVTSPNNTQIASFRKCGQIGSSNQVIAMTGGGASDIHIPGNLHIGDVVCTRTLTVDATLWNLRQDLIHGKRSGFIDGKLRVIDINLQP